MGAAHIAEVILAPSVVWRTAGGKPAMIKRWSCSCGAAGREHSRRTPDGEVLRGHASHVAAAKKRGRATGR